MTDERLMTVQDVADRLTVPVSWVYSAAERGILPSRKVGHYRRFVPSEITAWLDAHRQVSADA